MKINNVELENLDLMEADVMEDVETAIANVLEDIETGKNIDKMSEVIRLQCTAIMDCFNTIFGEGTDKKIFGNKTNLRECIKAFKELQLCISEEIEKENKEIDSIVLVENMVEDFAKAKRKARRK